MSNIILHLGSNQGDRFKLLKDAINLIKTEIGPIASQSSFYQTEAWGMKDQEDFINVAVALNAKLSAEELHNKIKNIEAKIGKNKAQKWGPRNIDIDIIFMGQKVIKTKDLTIPHPELEKRNFVLIPLMEIADDFIHPILKKSVEELYDECEDDCEVILLEE